RSRHRCVRAQRLRLLAAARASRGAGGRQVLPAVLSRRAGRCRGRLPGGAERAGHPVAARALRGVPLPHPVPQARPHGAPAPSPKRAQEGHGGVVRREARGAEGAALDERFERSWTTQAEPALGLARESGNPYTASLYLALAWLLEREGATLEDRELALFSYGSGCCAEFFTARPVARSAARAARIGVQTILQPPRRLTVAGDKEVARAAAR